MYRLTVHNAEDHPGRQFSDLINHLKYLYNLPSRKCYRETSRDILNNNLIKLSILKNFKTESKIFSLYFELVTTRSLIYVIFGLEHENDLLDL